MGTFIILSPCSPSGPHGWDHCDGTHYQGYIGGKLKAIRIPEEMQYLEEKCTYEKRYRKVSQKHVPVNFVAHRKSFLALIFFKILSFNLLQGHFRDVVSNL